MEFKLNPEVTSKKEFPISGGIMGDLIRSYNWSENTLGPIDYWSQSLKTAVNIVLQSPMPLVMLWGAEGIMLYNDAYSIFAGKRHPFLLGSKVVEGWPEVADFNRNVLKHVLHEGKTLSYKDQKLTLYRNNVPEEVWMDLNYSAILDESGKPAGVLAIVVETTQRAKAEEKQKLAEEALKNERQKLHDLFMQAPAAVVMLYGPDYKIEFANPVTLQIWGRKKEDVINKKLFEALPEIAGQGLEELLNGVYTTGIPFVGSELPIKIDRKGEGKPEDVYFTFTYSPLQNFAGQIEGVMVFANEVTEQVKARMIVEDQKQVLEMITTGASVSEAMEFLIQCIETRSNHKIIGSVLLLDKDGAHLNHCAAPGLSKEYSKAINGIAIGPDVGSCGTAAYTMKPIEVSDIATDPLWKNFKDLALSQGLHSCWSYPIISEDKVLGTFALYSREPQAPNEEDKKIIDFATRTAKLVIERKRIEEALRESEEQLRALITATSDVIYIMNADWSEMGELEGKVFVPDIGRPRKDWFTNNIPPSDQAMVRAAIEEAIKKKSIFQLEHRIRLSDDTIGWTSSRAIPILDNNGEIRKWFGAASDITERKLSEEALNEKNKQLMKINNDLDNFIYTASHDLRSPVSNLEGLFSTLLDEIQLNDELLNLKDMIDLSFEKFKATIKDLTEITKVQKEESDDLDTIRFSDILEDVNVNLKDQIENYGAEIMSSFEVPSLNFSRKNMRSILYNFISNAIKYSSPERKPAIKLTTMKKNNFVVLTITDNGLGISQANQKKIFQMFKRFHDHVEGSGIGLYIVKRIIDNIGGKIELESELNKGSTFRIFFPI